jgi:hypothetical protein
MANTEHVEKILQGKKVWNDWRLAYPAVEPDLSEVDFANLRWLSAGELRKHVNDWQGINLAGVDLQKAILSAFEL